jgi:hypothetical protein
MRQLLKWQLTFKQVKHENRPSKPDLKKMAESELMEIPVKIPIKPIVWVETKYDNEPVKPLQHIETKPNAIQITKKWWQFWK